ncbi:Zn-dependent exopeptidase [Gymnopus androsaceus JB14]|uniref:Zn-dependent exopeptidase n=1 Tax=Gymnopus androsaceus JB14 TaxID=1447944 RepID=A0A6A4HRI6_9AGAR|nr:Zn-dependent exopeptidase [Gymnopus androsaceus JB14]
MRRFPDEAEPTIVLCPQVHPLAPKKHSKLSKQLDRIHSSESFKHTSYQLLGASIRIPTESYDDLLPVGQDNRWRVFHDFHAYLEDSFPRIYSTLSVTKINTYGLVFHWQGSDYSLKPLLLTAHQDVVPVDWSTEDQWAHGPYSGLYDGTWIWGRGSVDDKADLVSQLVTVTSLLEAGFKPRRTLVLTFGFDEEASGTEAKGYGENLKEGVIFAGPGISEKGYLDARIEVLSPGGHSSIPPDHTSIGLLSLLIVSLEANPSPSHRKCAVEYNTKPGKFPPNMKDLARRAMKPHGDVALDQFADALFKADPFFKVLSHTTQAVDLISGGFKANALPERAEAVVNHRIAEFSSALEVRNHIKDLVLPFAALYNLSVDAFGQNVREDGSGLGKIVLSDAHPPVTPIINSRMYDILSGTIKATLQSSTRYQADDVVVTPSLGLDTRFYWNLTRNIFRYSHRGDRDDMYNGFTYSVRGESFIEQIRFFTKLILNVDEVESD